MLLAALNSEGRLLAFPVADLPELPRGKGNKIFGIPSKKAASAREPARDRRGRARADRCACSPANATWA